MSTDTRSDAPGDGAVEFERGYFQAIKDIRAYLANAIPPRYRRRKEVTGQASEEWKERSREWHRRRIQAARTRGVSVPEPKPGLINSDAHELRLLLADVGDDAPIMQVSDVAFEDKFWCDVVVSAKQLRKHWDKLAGRAATIGAVKGVRLRGSAKPRIV